MRGINLLFIALLLSSVMAAQPNPGDFLANGPTQEKKLALTFDDGPGPMTDQYLDLLEKHGVKGTFFMLAEQVGYRSNMAKLVAERGHEVASHTFNHTNYLKVYRSLLEKNNGSTEAAIQETKAQLKSDMAKSRAIIEKATDRKLKILRMPHGIDRPWVNDVAREEGFVLVNWTYGSDWLREPKEKLEQDYVKAIKPGAILLFHDGGRKREKSLYLTEAVIKEAKAQGYEIVTLGELIGVSEQ